MVRRYWTSLLSGIAIGMGLLSSASQATPRLDTTVLPEAGSESSQLLAQLGTSSATVISIDQRSLTVTGTGQMSAPADQALLQLFYYPTAPVDLSLPAVATPIAASDLRFIVDALTELGIPASDIQVFADPNTYGGAKIQLKLAQPTTDRLTQIVSRVNEVVAEDARFSPSGSSIIYTINECSAVENEARRAALTDAQTRAADFANTASVEIGEILTLSDSSSWNLGYSTTCPVTDGLPPAPFQYGGYPFDPTVPPVVNVTTQVTATYAIQD